MNETFVDDAGLRSRRVLRAARRAVIGIVLGGLLFFLILYCQPRALVRWIAARDASVLYFVPTSAPVVALTLDDGPHPVFTPQILDLLKAHSARATFFLIGDRISGNEALLERMRREGHELGNHLRSDCASLLLSPEQFERELLEVDRRIQPIGPVKWMRPGSGLYSARMLRQVQAHGYRCALGSVYPFDPEIRSESLVSAYVLRRVFPGGIIILHDGPSVGRQSVAVLRRVLPALNRRGYKIVTLSELINM